MGTDRGTSTNQQFNEGYEQMVETVKSRAIWRVGQRVEEGQGFRCHCPKCATDGPHYRFDVTRQRLLFGRSIRAIGSPMPMVRCRRCGKDRHLRDVGELVAPSTIALHDDIIAAARQAISAGSWSTDAPDVPPEVEARLPAFRDEASGPVRVHLLTSIAPIEDAGQMLPMGPSEPMLRAIGRALFLHTDEIDATITSTSAD